MYAILHQRPRQDLSKVVAVGAIASAALAAFLFFGSRQVIWDIGWLIEASRRWLRGAVLYRDIIEVNPPLIFYETVALSAGLLTQRAFIGGVCVAILSSGLWILRLRGPYVAICATLAMILAGSHDFGQRDHLALIFGLPFLMRERPSRIEGALVGCWAFFGFGLKPYLLLIPLADGVTRAVLDRSVRTLLSAPYLALSLLCGAYLLAVAAIHPIYFSSMVPLGRFVYWAYDAPLRPDLALLSLVVGFTALAVFLARERSLFSIALAMLAALSSFYIQGRYWTYHFVPALGLALVIALVQSSKSKQFGVLAALLIASQLARGLSPRVETAIPKDVHSVAILSSQVGAAYPTVVDRGITNATRYPALWVLPGAWSIANDQKRSARDRGEASSLLAQQRAIIRGDILSAHPDLIMADHALAHFDRPFDYIEFLGPFPGYRYAGRVGRFDYYRRITPLQGSWSPPAQ